MARNIVPVVFDNPYTPDRGGSVEGLSYRVAQPADVTDAQLDAILAPLGARRKTAADRVPCPVAGDFRPRKLRFVRQDGNSLSLVIPSHTAALTVAAAIRDSLNAAVVANQVVCIELLGEQWFDLAPNLGASGAPVAGTESRSTLGGKQYVHSGKILYEYDGGAGATVTTAVRVDTDAVAAGGVTSPPSILGTAWTDCVGAFEEENPCSSRRGLDHRRYIAVLKTANGYQTTEVPVKSTDSADILACGQAIAGLASLTCLPYQGETNKRLHTFLA